MARAIAARRDRRRALDLHPAVDRGGLHVLDVRDLAPRGAAMRTSHDRQVMPATGSVVAISWIGSAGAGAAGAGAVGAASRPAARAAARSASMRSTDRPSARPLPTAPRAPRARAGAAGAARPLGARGCPGAVAGHRDAAPGGRRWTRGRSRATAHAACRTSGGPCRTGQAFLKFPSRSPDWTPLRRWAAPGGRSRPVPGPALSAHARPSIASARARTIARPIPAPPAARLRAGSTR